MSYQIVIIRAFLFYVAQLLHTILYLSSPYGKMRLFYSHRRGRDG